jgi:hypothetical protein
MKARKSASLRTKARLRTEYPILECDEREIQRLGSGKDTANMANGPRWNGKTYKQAKFGDVSANAAMKKRMHNAQMREWRLRREAAAKLALAEIDAARFARLPWPVRVVGVILDIVFRRKRPGDNIST